MVATAVAGGHRAVPAVRWLETGRNRTAHPGVSAPTAGQAAGQDHGGTRNASSHGRLAAVALFTLLVAAGPMLACGGLIGPNGAVNLLRTTTFAGYHDGVEHYVTAFEFAGGGGKFGSIIPLPGVPTNVERGGDWTLQRLVRETTPVRAVRRSPSPASVQPTPAARRCSSRPRSTRSTSRSSRAAAPTVGEWATEHGFRLPPDAPEVLDFYAARSPIFLAAAFDADAAKARGQQIGDGTPVHITIPTDNPWVPLRILGLGKIAGETVSGRRLPHDRSSTGPAPGPGRERPQRSTTTSPPATSLLDDLRSDKGMDWVPNAAWLTKIGIDADPTRADLRPRGRRDGPGRALRRRGGPRAHALRPVTPGGTDGGRR